MERHAERVQAQQHIVRYRLTRESIYQGLESGTAPDELLERLRDGAATELPQNVLATIREWAGLREKITLRRPASLLEFKDPATRQTRLDAGLKGTPVADRFVLLATRVANDLADARVDYTLPPPDSLVALEDGRITQVTEATDLLLQPQLNRWAERGDHPKAELTRITVLCCTRPIVFAAIASSPACMPYLRATLAPDLLLVDERYVKLLRQQLAWAGLDVGRHWR